MRLPLTLLLFSLRSPSQGLVFFLIVALTITLTPISWNIPGLFALTIVEKRAQLLQQQKGSENSLDKELHRINQAMGIKQEELENLHDELSSQFLSKNGQTLSEEEKRTLNSKLQSITSLRKQILDLKREWKAFNVTESDQSEYGLWQQPDTTIAQLIQDYGSYDHVYIIPPEIGSIKIGVSSNLSIPRSNWPEMLDLLLAHYGIGTHQLNPYMRQLFFLRINQSGVCLVTDERNMLSSLPQNARACFIICPQPTESRRVFRFLEKFAHQEQMTLHTIGSDIALVGYVREIEEILKMYDFIAAKHMQQEYKLVNLKKAKAEEVAKIVLSIFEEEASKNGSEAMTDKGGLLILNDQAPSFRVIPVQHPTPSLFLIGKPNQIVKAQEIIQEIEGRIGENNSLTLYWYSCKHSDPEELAKTISQVYTQLSQSKEIAFLSPEREKLPNPLSATPSYEKLTSDTQIPSSSLIVNPQPVLLKEKQAKKMKDIAENFIVDPKTGSIVMVVEKDLLPKIKELLKKLDIPKKMVEIDVLLFEKKLVDSNNFGLNLLRLGDSARKKHRTSWSWNDLGEDHSNPQTNNQGILQFSLSRKHSASIPALDLGYQFLLSREDVQINANPTVTTVNQTPAKIAVVDEIYVSTGVVLVDSDKATRFKDSYEKNQYGITIQITPTIHAKSDDEENVGVPQFITLETDIVFDTTKTNTDGRPEATRRNIKNEVRVKDGETLVLGGLRRKSNSDSRDSIPFLGEIPGIGKLFSTSSLNDAKTEMFIFITPRIVPDQEEKYHALLQEELLKRPGDLPELIYNIMISKQEDKERLFERGLRVLFDSPLSSKPKKGPLEI